MPRAGNTDAAFHAQLGPYFDNGTTAWAVHLVRGWAAVLHVSLFVVFAQRPAPGVFPPSARYDDDALDESPQATYPNGYNANNDLSDADTYVSKVETVHSDRPQEYA